MAALALASVVLVPAGPALAQAATAITGVYDGAYRCSGVTMALRLAIVAGEDGAARGRFTFSRNAKPAGASGSFNVKGNYDAATKRFQLDPQNWNPPVPPGFAMHGVDGSFDERGGRISGRIRDCSPFRATSNQAESAKLPARPPAPPAMEGHTARPAPRMNPAPDAPDAATPRK